MRLLRVKAVNPKGNMIEVGVLTDDKQRAAPEIIDLIFNRWIQENDFKYLNQHFGINELTSYTSIPYRELEDHFEQKQMKAGAYKALEESRRDIRNSLKDALLMDHRNTKSNKTREEKIENLTRRLEEIEAQMLNTEKEVSRLDYLIENEFVRLDTGGKQLMDALKLIARNAYYNLFSSFRELYDNYRDDHVLFRNLIQSNGIIHEDGDVVNVILISTAHHQPKLKNIFKTILELINQNEPVMPNNSGIKLRFHLGDKAGINLAIIPGQKGPFY